MVEAGLSCVKYLLFFFNFLFWICGIALIAVGAIVQTNGNQYTTFLDSKFFTAPSIIIAVGCIVFLLAFMGCWGALRENTCMLTTFAVLLFLIFIIEIAGGIAAYVYRNDVQDFIKKRMQETIDQDKEDAKKAWDEMQKKLTCCGVDGPKDYEKGNTTAIPASCCKDSKDCTDKTAYQKGCFTALLDVLKQDIAKVGGAGIGIAVIELIGVMFSCCLVSAIKRGY